jgi:hypothetical protein
MPRPRPRRDELSRLEAADLEELMRRHPAIWRAVGEQLVAAVKGGPPAIEAFVRRAAAEAAPWRERVERSHGNPEVLAAALAPLAGARMARLAAQRALLAAAAGQPSGTVRLDRLTGWLAQRLLFESPPRALARKPASLRAFRLLWPLAPGRRRLMPLVQAQGIWCFYTRELVTAIARLARGRPALEIGAGDGTLARFLGGAGMDIRATDDQSWPRPGGYPPEVERLDAAAAVARYRPAVVVCSFPPPGNGFEQRVLRAPSVETYVAIASRQRFAAGDWEAYEGTVEFAGGVDERLSAMVLPPEIEPAVLVLERRAKTP